MNSSSLGIRFSTGTSRPDEDSGKFVAKTNLENQPSDKVRFTARMILFQIGLESLDQEEDYTDILFEKFGSRFPPAREFSAFARSTVDADPVGDPDGTLCACIIWRQDNS